MKTLVATLDPEDFLREQIAQGLAQLIKVRSKWHPLWKLAFDALSENQKRCPFAYEHSRGPGELWVCSERHVESCGCQKNGIPKPRDRWKRHAP